MYEEYWYCFSNPSSSARNAENQQIIRFTHNLTHTNAKVVRNFIVFY